MFRCILFLLIAQTSIAQDYFVGTAPGSASGLNIHFEDANALFYNPAGLAKVESFEFMISYQSRFLLNDVNSISFGAASQLSETTSIGVSFSYLGATEYDDYKIGLQLGQKIGKNSSLGIGLFTRYLDLEEYGATVKPDVSLGYQFSVGLFDFAGKIQNPFSISLHENEELPIIYAGGFKYNISVDAAIGIQYFKQKNFTRSIMVSIEYRFSEQIQFFGGFQTNPQNIHVGISTPLFHDSSILTFGNSWFNNIGSSPIASFHYSKRNNQ